MATNKAIEIKLLKSLASSTELQRANLIGLGLKRINQTVVRVDTPSTRGMIKKIAHMIDFKKAVLGSAMKPVKKADFTISASKVTEPKAAKSASKSKKSVKE